MNTTVNAGLYMRLSVEDETNNESTSIQTQRAMLTDYCREKGFRIVDYYVDDGETGTNFERPESQQRKRKTADGILPPSRRSSRTRCTAVTACKAAEET